MPLADASRRGADLNCRLAVNGIHQAERSRSLRGASSGTAGPFRTRRDPCLTGAAAARPGGCQTRGKPATAFSRAQEIAAGLPIELGAQLGLRAWRQRSSARAASRQQVATAADTA